MILKETEMVHVGTKSLLSTSFAYYITNKKIMQSSFMLKSQKDKKKKKGLFSIGVHHVY
jgi:hypothetical protein